MVKKVSARSKVNAKLARQKQGKESEATAGAQGNGASDKSVPKPVGFSVGKTGKHATRKIAKQMRFVQKLQTTQAALAPTKIIAKRKKRGRKGGRLAEKPLATLDALAMSLPSVADCLGARTAFTRETKIVRSRDRREIAKEETKQLAAVLSHPRFQEDPFAAIKKHLENTLPPPPEPKAPNDGPKGGNKKKGKGKRKVKGTEEDNMEL